MAALGGTAARGAGRAGACATGGRAVGGATAASSTGASQRTSVRGTAPGTGVTGTSAVAATRGLSGTATAAPARTATATPAGPGGTPAGTRSGGRTGRGGTRRNALCALAHEVLHDLGTGCDLVHAGRDTGLLHELVDVRALLGGRDRDHGPGGAGPRRAAGAVQVGLVLGGRVDVHDELDVVHVDTARGHVRGHEDPHVTRGERGEIAVPRALGQVTLQVHRGDPGLTELLGHLLGAILGAGEHHPPTGARREGLDQRLLVIAVGDQDVVVHGGHRGLGVVRRVQHRVLEELLDQDVHAVVQGRGEQQPLGALGGAGQDPGDHGQEAHVGHVVGLVQDGHADVVEREQTLLDEVLEPARAGHDDVHTARERLLLVLLGDTAEDHGGLQPRDLGQGGHGAVDLGRELTRGSQHQSGGAVRPAGHAGRAGGETREPGHERQRERDRLARAGAAAAEHVTPGQ